LSIYCSFNNFEGHYALFLLNKRGNVDMAGTLYKQAVTAQPNDSEALGNLAWFLSGDHCKGRHSVNITENV
jgi:Tfp pilus assembly protein PilF